MAPRSNATALGLSVSASVAGRNLQVTGFCFGTSTMGASAHRATRFERKVVRNSRGM